MASFNRWLNTLLRKPQVPVLGSKPSLKALNRFRPLAEVLEDRRLLSGNNTWASAPLIPSDNYTDYDNNISADGEAGEPDNYGVSAPINSMWWKWTASSDGTCVIDLQGSDYDTTIGAYVGSSVSSLSEIASNDDYWGLQSQITFPAANGTTYYISVDGYSSSIGNIQLNLNFGGGGGLDNDMWANARTLTGANDSDTGTNVGATEEFGEPDNAFVSAPINSVWWKWTAPGDGSTTISLETSSYDTTIGAYTGNAVDNLTEIASNDDYWGLQSQISFTAVGGTLYYISVDGYSAGTGNIAISLDYTGPTGPANDNFANAFTLTGTADSDTGTNTGSTGETGEPNHAGDAGARNSVWWNWTPAISGTCTIDTFGSNYDTVLAVYTGSAVNGLSPVASNDDTGGSQSLVNFAATAGTTYRIAVDGAGAATGNVTINLNEALGPNTPPVAEANGNYTVGEGGSVPVSSTGSFDPDGSIVAFEWDFNYDGVTFQVDATGASPSFSAVGIDGLSNRTIALRVTDNRAGTAIDTATVTINNVAPTISNTGNNGPVGEGSAATVTITATDPAGALDPLLYEFDFDNNGTYEIGPQAGSTSNHTYADNGTYQVNVRVTDGDGGVQTSSTMVSVNNIAPTITSTGNNGPINETSSATVTINATDPAGVNDPLSYQFDFDNDGAYEVGPQAGNTSNHAFADNGSYTVNVRVTDGDGGVRTSSTTIVVNNVVPNISSFVNDGAISEGNSVNVTATATDIAGVNDPLTYEFDFDNDGTYEVGPQPGSTAAHTFGDNGVFQVRVRVSDDDGGTATTTTNVTVNNIAPSIAGATASSPTDEGQLVTITVNASDPAGAFDPLLYELDFDNNGVFEVGPQSSSSLQYIFPDNGTFNITVRVNDGDGGLTTSIVSVIVNNLPPIITNVNNDGPTTETNQIIVQINAADPAVLNDPLLYEYDFDNDGTYEVGPQSANTAAHTYPDNGQYHVNIRVTDGDGGVATTSTDVIVNNLVPTATATGDTNGVPGQMRTFTVGADDPADADDAYGFIYRMQWGDGSQDDLFFVHGTALGTRQHAFTGTGTFNVIVTAEDKNGGVSSAVIHTVQIDAVQMQGTTLAIGGSDLNDAIKVTLDRTNAGAIRLTRNLVGQTIAGATRLEIYTLGGNDKVTVSPKVILATEMHGGDGNDKLKGGNGSNLILGDAGNDTITGGILRDVLIGGIGNDNIKAKPGDDILVGSATDHDDDHAALLAIMTEWNSGSAYAARVAHLDGTTAGGLNGTTFLNLASVHDDGAQDLFAGSKDFDWFIIHRLDFITGENPVDDAIGETVTTV